MSDIRVTYAHNRFIAYCDVKENDHLKAAGFLWDPGNKIWYTIDFRSADKLKQFHDDSAKDASVRLAELAKRSIIESAAATGTMQLYHPESMKPFPYQVAGVEYILKRRGVILADEQGLGKSMTALVTMNMRKDVEALIVCLAILKTNWLKEARKWIIGHITAYIYDSKKIKVYKKQLTPHNKSTVLHIVNYDILDRHFERFLGTPYNHFIADECQKIKNDSAQRTKIAQQLARKAPYKIFITGTPIYNKPKDLFVPINLIDPHMFGNFHLFALKYCGAKTLKFGGKTITKYDGATNLDELNQVLRSNYMIRRMTEEVMKDLPKKIKDVIILNEDVLDKIVRKEQNLLISAKQEQEKLEMEIARLREVMKTDASYETIYKNKVATLKKAKFQNFGEMSKIRKEMAIKKVPYVLEFVKEMLDSSEDPQSKVVVFAHHQEVIQLLNAGLKKYKPLVIYGGTSAPQRELVLKAFRQKNEYRVFIGSMGAAGTGVDGLQLNCNRMVFAELDWTPSLVDQAESRLARIGQKLPVFIYHIVADQSIDSHIAKLMVQKTAIAQQILDYRPEQIYEKMLQGAKTELIPKK